MQSPGTSKIGWTGWAEWTVCTEFKLLNLKLEPSGTKYTNSSTLPLFYFIIWFPSSREPPQVYVRKKVTRSTVWWQELSDFGDRINKNASLPGDTIAEFEVLNPVKDRGFWAWE